jgi:hypothetical protein
MFKIVCIEENPERLYTIASGFHDEIEARDTAKDWIIRRLFDVAYDRSDGCWWLIDGGRAYRVAIQKISKMPHISSTRSLSKDGT